MRDVVIAAACRTAIGTFGGALKDLSAVQLGSLVIQDLHVMRGTQHVLRGVSLDVNPGQISVLTLQTAAGWIEMVEQ